MRLSRLIICACGLLLFGASAYAAVKTDDAGNAVSAKKSSVNAKSTKKNIEKIIAGPVTSINVEKKEIIVSRSGKRYPVTLDGSTQLQSGNTTVTLDQIKVGDHVSIAYVRSSDGRRTALTIDSKSLSAPGKTALKEAKAEAKKTSAAPKTEVKKEAATAPKAEAKADVKKDTASAAKAEVKVAKKDSVQAAKAEVKVAKKDSVQAAKAEVKVAKKDSVQAVKAEVKVAKKDSVQAAKASN
jgi:hypothetical protein